MIVAGTGPRRSCLPRREGPEDPMDHTTAPRLLSRELPSEVFLASILGATQIDAGFACHPRQRGRRQPRARDAAGAALHFGSTRGIPWAGRCGESIRISVRLAEAFAQWTRTGDGDIESLGPLLTPVQDEARNPEPISLQVGFDQLLEGFPTCRRERGR